MKAREQQVSERPSIISFPARSHASLLPALFSLHQPFNFFACVALSLFLTRKVEKDASFRTGSDPATDTHLLKRQQKQKKSSGKKHPNLSDRKESRESRP